jgi:rhodanese-related sulfurtransferase
MPKAVSLVSLGVLALAALPLCALTPQKPATEAAAAAAPADPAAQARRINAADARQALAQGEAVLVDVRDRASFAAQHAKGALSIPFQSLPARAGELPKDKLIITYCTCHAESTSARAVLDLQAQGFAQAAALVDGLNAWKEAGGEVATSSP